MQNASFTVTVYMLSVIYILVYIFHYFIFEHVVKLIVCIFHQMS